MGKSDEIPGSSDLFAVPVTEMIHPVLGSLHDTILVVSTSPKELPSSQGHFLMRSHPFGVARIRQAVDHLQVLLKAMMAGDLERIAGIVEQEAMTLHALIMSSPGAMILMEPQTVQILKKIRERRRQGLEIFFSLDAGPNVHLLYPEPATPAAEKFIRDELVPLCENGLIINDRCGTGPGCTKITTE